MEISVRKYEDRDIAEMNLWQSLRNNKRILQKQ